MQISRIGGSTQVDHQPGGTQRGEHRVSENDKDGRSLIQKISSLLGGRSINRDKRTKLLIQIRREGKAHVIHCQTSTITAFTQRRVDPKITSLLCGSNERNGRLQVAVLLPIAHANNRTIVAVGQPGSQFGVAQSFFLGFLGLFRCAFLQSETLALDRLEYSQLGIRLTC